MTQALYAHMNNKKIKIKKRKKQNVWINLKYIQDRNSIKFMCLINMAITLYIFYIKIKINKLMEN
jgi:hypothetical protein